MADLAAIEHIMNRAGFGASRATMQSLSSLTSAQIVEQLMDPARGLALDSPRADMQVTAGDEWYKEYALTYWMLDRMARSQAPLVEKMVWFWHSTLVTGTDKVENMRHTYNQHMLFRSLGLGNYRTLLHAFAKDPSTLVYLDNRDNSKRSANHNFARELMELFTLGVGNYTEQDVIEVGRAWTGHAVGYKYTDSYVFRPDDHDTGQKVIFGTTRDFDGPDVVDHIFATKPMHVARFVARRMWEFFAGPPPSESTNAAIAQAFLDADFEIRPLVRSIFSQPEFYSADVLSGQVLRPIDLVAKLSRICQLARGDLDSLSIRWNLGRMGQQPFNPPDVSGWKENAGWLGTSNIGARAETIRAAAHLACGRGRFSQVSLGQPSTAVQTLLDAVGLVTISSGSRSTLESYAATRHGQYGSDAEKRADLLTMVLLSPEGTMNR